VDTLSEEDIIQVSAGQYHSLALSKSGRVYSWGWGVHGQLGNRCTDDQLIPTLITSLADKVQNTKNHTILTSDMLNVFYFLTKLNTENFVFFHQHIVQVCGAHGHSVVLTKGGEVWAFGSGAFGQLGVPCFAKSSIPIQIELPEPIRLIACAYFHCVSCS
jgi:alpha-tubulin suppressor-like RCC1 family protein